MSERARTYRKLEHLDDLQGTAVTVQAMVFGNAGISSGAGVAFSRDPSTGADKPVIDVLFESQGEDVVSGGHNPETEDAIARLASRGRHAIARSAAPARTRISPTSRTWNSPSRTASCGCCRPAQQNERRRPRCDWPSTLCGRGGLRRRSAAASHGVDLSALVNKRLIVTGAAGFTAESAHRPALPSDARRSIRKARPAWRPAANRSFWFVPTPRRLMSAGLPLPTASLRQSAAEPLMRRWSRGRWESRASSAATDCRSTLPVVARRLAGAAIKEGDWLSIDGEAGAIYLGRGEIVTERPEAELAEIESWRRAAA